MQPQAQIFRTMASFCLSFDSAGVEPVIAQLEAAYHERKTIYLFGNGGSAATASHFCQDLGKGTIGKLLDSKRIKAVSLTDNVPYLLAWANDAGYEAVFEQQLRNLAEAGDIAIGISCSGNSRNVLRAIDYANTAKLVTIGMTAFDGGDLKTKVQYNIHVPFEKAGMAEVAHLLIAHYIVESLRSRLAR